MSRFQVTQQKCSRKSDSAAKTLGTGPDYYGLKIDGGRSVFYLRSIAFFNVNSKWGLFAVQKTKHEKRKCTKKKKLKNVPLTVYLSTKKMRKYLYILALFTKQFHLCVCKIWSSIKFRLKYRFDQKSHVSWPTFTIKYFSETEKSTSIKKNVRILLIQVLFSTQIWLLAKFERIFQHSQNVWRIQHNFAEMHEKVNIPSRQLFAHDTYLYLYYWSNKISVSYSQTYLKQLNNVIIQTIFLS